MTATKPNREPKVVCSICGTRLRGPQDAETVSHGLCRACYHDTTCVPLGACDCDALAAAWPKETQ